MAMELERTDRGALVVFDELGAFLGGLEKYGQGRGAYERAFWNESYNGGWFKQNRASRKKIDVPNLCVGIIGAIQPELISKIIGLSVDGLTQRFNMVLMQPGVRSQEPEDEWPAEDWAAQITHLLQMPRQGYHLAAGARDILSELEDEVEALMGLRALPSGLRGWIGKAPGVLGSLALILHALGSDDPAYDTQISADTMGRALRVLRFLQGHAAVFYDNENGGDPMKLRDAASYLLTTIKERFTPADLTRNVGSWREVERRTLIARMGVLVACDVVTEFGGPHAPVWIVNPSWRAALADQRQIELAQRRKTRAALQRMRGLPVEEDEP